MFRALHVSGNQRHFYRATQQAQSRDSCKHYMQTKTVAISSVHSPAKAAATGASQCAAAEFGCMPHHKKLTVSIRSTPTGCHIQFGCKVGHVAIQIPKTRHWQRPSLFACTGLMKDIVSVCSAHSQLKGAGLLNAACPGANVSTDHVVQDLLHSLLGFSVLLITQQCRRPADKPSCYCTGRLSLLPEVKNLWPIGMCLNISGKGCRGLAFGTSSGMSREAFCKADR